ncbi:MAG: tetratricopeptide repeat protein, partial [bacterium]|nr:tetratricopeptide repeat protein [bacterium]
MVCAELRSSTTTDLPSAEPTQLAADLQLDPSAQAIIDELEARLHALASCADLHGESSPEHARHRRSLLSSLRQAEALLQDDDPDSLYTVTRIYESLVRAYEHLGPGFEMPHRHAENTLERAFGQWSKAYDDLYRRAVAYSNNAQYLEALAAAHDLVTVSELFAQRDPIKRGDALTVFAQLNIDLHRFSTAASLFKEAVEVLAASYRSDPGISPRYTIGVELMLASRRDRLAALYERIGYLSEAEEQYRKALAIRERLPQSPNVRAELGYSFSRLGSLLLEQHRPEEAEHFSLMALDLSREAMDAAIADSDVVEMVKAIVEETGEHYTVASNYADALNNVGLVYTALGKYDEAEAAFKESHQIDSEWRPHSRVELAKIRENLSFLYAEQGQFERAIEEGKEALELLATSGQTDELIRVSILQKLGNMNLAKGDFGEAERLLSIALPTQEALTAANAPSLSNTYTSMGWLRFAQGRWEESSEFFRKANRIRIARATREVRSLRSGADRFAWHLQGQARSSFAGELLAAPFLISEGAHTSHEVLERSFIISQWEHWSKAGFAASKMAERLAFIDPTHAALVRERQDLAIVLDLLNDAVIRASSQQVLAPSSELSPLREEIDRLVDRISEIDEIIPEYKDLTTPNALTVGEVQGLLLENEVLVQLVDVAAEGRNLLVWIVPKHSAPFFRSVTLTDGSLHDAVQTLRCGLDWEEWQGIESAGRCASALDLLRMPSENGPLPFDLGLAHQLYRWLLGPVEDLIAGKELLVVASGPLTVDVKVVVASRFRSQAASRAGRPCHRRCPVRPLYTRDALRGAELLRV